MKSALIETELGPFRAQFTETGLARLQFPRAKADPVADAIEPPAKWLRHTTSVLHTMLQGNPPRTLPPLDRALCSANDLGAGCYCPDFHKHVPICSFLRRLG